MAATLSPSKGHFLPSTLLIGIAPILVDEIKIASLFHISSGEGDVKSILYPSSLQALSTLILVIPSSTFSSGAVFIVSPLST